MTLAALRDYLKKAKEKYPVSTEFIKKHQPAAAQEMP